MLRIYYILELIVKRKFLLVDKKKLYYPNKKINQTDAFYKLNTLNVKRLSVFINKLLNLTNVSI